MNTRPTQQAPRRRVALRPRVRRGMAFAVFAAAAVSAAPAAADTYTVTNVRDGGLDSLRWAITRANGNAGPDDIVFTIPGPVTKVHVITPASDLPPLLDETSLLGYTQPGSSVATDTSPAELRVVIDATAASQGLRLTGDNSRVDGIVVHSAAAAGAIGSHGVLISGDGNQVTGSRIGTDATGILAAANLEDGIRVEGNANVIGGATVAEANLISGNGGDGIEVRGDDNVILGNRIGVDASGSVELANDDAGVEVSGDANVVGGPNAGEGNLLSGNDDGVEIAPFPALGANDLPSENEVEGNLIGTDANGTIAIPNRYSGVDISGAVENTIGGTVAGAGNVIAANDGDGISIGKQHDDQPDGNAILGNSIGTDRTGLMDLGNGANGILIDRANETKIGDGSDAGANTIAFNGEDGVVIIETDEDSANANSIIANSIHSNDQLGIDLDDDGVTANDPIGTGDPDEGPNGFMNFPFVKRTSRVAVTPRGPFLLTVDWDFYSLAGTEFRVDVYWSPQADPSLHGEGKIHLGVMTKTTSIAGTASGTFTTLTSLPPGVISMTATRMSAGGPIGTSEFSLGVTG